MSLPPHTGCSAVFAHDSKVHLALRDTTEPGMAREERWVRASRPGFLAYLILPRDVTTKTTAPSTLK